MEDGDLPELLSVAEEFWKDSGTGVDFEEGQCRKSFETMQRFGFVFVSESEGVLTGFISCLEAPMLASSKTVCAESAWYVKPAYRATGAGLKLMKAAEAEAKARGCHILSMTYMETSMPKGVKTLYEKSGLELQETTHRKLLWEQ